MLISQHVYNLLSEKMKKLMRMIDRVTFKGSAEPMKIYTFDLNTNNLLITSPQSSRMGNNKKKVRVDQILAREELRKDM